LEVGNMTQTGDFDIPGMASDAEVVARVLAGETASFELLMRRYNRRLYRIARGVLRNDADAEDAVQDAYLSAFESLGRYQGTGPMSAWLAKITFNEALGRLRRRENAAGSISFDDPGEGEEANFMADLISSLPSPEQNAARAEVRRLLELAIDALPNAYRMVFILCGVEEMSVAETATCLDVEPATVKTRYHRARKLLQQRLAGLVESNVGEVFSFDGVRCDRIVSGVLLKLGDYDRNKLK
jgi:RNA polymerase sigma-70 factor, ECF subfamily